MTTVISVKFRGGSRLYYFSPGELEINAGDGVIVETARGTEYGDVMVGIHDVPDDQVIQPLKEVIRVATDRDREMRDSYRAKEKDAYATCMERIQAHGLDMKLVDVEYTFNGSKIVFYFTADGRVDFRELVKDLASVFKTRIELRQIGVRDEAKMLGGLGICGRPFCCASYMDEFVPVSIKMAKTQSLSLNPTKISGTCGRLMCCLKYEQDAYEDAIKRMPKNDSFVVTPDGPGNVSEINVLKETVNVRLDDRPDTPRCYHNCEVCVLRNGKGSRDGITVPRERPERYVEPVAAEEMLIPDLFADYGVSTPETPQEGEGRPTRRRNRGGRRRGKGGAQEIAAPQLEAKKEKPAKTDAPQGAGGKEGEAPRREGEGQRRRRNRGGRGRGGDKPAGQNSANANGNTNTNTAAAPKPEASPRPEGAGEGQRRRRSRGGRRRSGNKTGGTSNSEA